MNVNDIIISLTNIPVFYSFLLGLLVAISPCTIATNIAAVSFLAEKENKSKILSNGFFYALGRTSLYTLLGMFIYLFVDNLTLGMNFQQSIGKIIGPLFIFIGFMMLDIIHLHGWGEKCISKLNFKEINKGASTSFICGILLALAFCPYSAALYFGALMPLTISSTNGIGLPLIFALGSLIPLLLIVFLLYKGFDKIDILSSKYKKLERLTQRLVGMLLIIAGIMFVYEYYIE